MLISYISANDVEMLNCISESVFLMERTHTWLRDNLDDIINILVDDQHDDFIRDSIVLLGNIQTVIVMIDSIRSNLAGTGATQSKKWCDQSYQFSFTIITDMLQYTNMSIRVYFGSWQGSINRLSEHFAEADAKSMLEEASAIEKIAKTIIA